MEAQAHGTELEMELLLPMVTALQVTMHADTVVTADMGYHREANLRTLHEQNILGLIAHQSMRRHDARFTTQAQHQQAPHPRHNKAPVDIATAGFASSH